MTAQQWGWTGGWLASFAWVAIAALKLLLDGSVLPGVLGLLVTLVAVTLIVACAPWRFPNTMYWLLMTPLYLVFFLALAWIVWSHGDAESVGFRVSPVLLVLLLPIVVVGRKRWSQTSPP